MNREDFLNFLLENSCIIVRTDKKGYSVARNTISGGGQSGVPANDPLKPTTICNICRNLKLDIVPDESEIYRAKSAIDKIHANIEANKK